MEREFKIGEEVRVKGLVRGSDNTPEGFVDVFIQPVVIRLPKDVVFTDQVSQLANFLLKDYGEEFGKGSDPGAGEGAVEMAIRLLKKTKNPEMERLVDYLIKDWKSELAIPETEQQKEWRELITSKDPEVGEGPVDVAIRLLKKYKEIGSE